MELITQIINQLGVNEDQAKGGAGLLLNLAKEKLSSAEFGQIANNIDGLDDILGAAPDTSSGLGGLLGGLAGALGGDKMGDLAELANGFSKLDLDASMVTQFLPVITDFLEQKGGAGIVEIIQNALAQK